MIVGFCREIVGFVVPAARIFSDYTWFIFPRLVVININIPYRVPLLSFGAGAGGGDGGGGGDVRQADVGG